MSTKQKVENKISAVAKYLLILQRYKKYRAAEIKNDIDRRGAVERYLYLAVQSTIDLATTFIAYKNLRKPTSLSDAFYVLDEAKIIPVKLTEKMIAMTGFRNVIAHDYDKVDYNVVYDILHHGIKDMKNFLSKIQKKI